MKAINPKLNVFLDNKAITNISSFLNYVDMFLPKDAEV